MGCRQSHLNYTEKLTEDDNTHDNVVEVDSRLPLDARQVFKLKQSWKGIKRKIEEAGVEMFIRLFKTNSYLKDMFTQFKGIESEDELRNNELLEHHATFVMSTLDEAISNIDNYDFVQQSLHRVGCSHRRFSGFEPSNFWRIKGPFLEAMSITLGDRYTPYMQTVYELTITFIIQNLLVGYSPEDTTDALKSDSINHNSNKHVS